MFTTDEAKLGAAPFRVTDHTRIPASRPEEIPEVGDWCDYTILDKSVIV